ALVRAEPGRLDRVADAEPDIAALFARLRLACLEARVVGAIERAGLAGRIVAAVVGDGPAVAKDDSDLVRHLRRRDEIAPAHLGAVELHLARDAVDEALHHHRRLRPASAAHR